jgi:hypothetical protein
VSEMSQQENERGECERVAHPARLVPGQFVRNFKFKQSLSLRYAAARPLLWFSSSRWLELPFPSIK